MRESLAALMTALQQSINENIIPLYVTTELPKIKQELQIIQAEYLKKNPDGTGVASDIIKKLNIAGLTQNEIDSFLGIFTSDAATQKDLWNNVNNHASFKKSKGEN